MRRTYDPIPRYSDHGYDDELLRRELARYYAETWAMVSEPPPSPSPAPTT